MKLLINTASTFKGGGVQVAKSFLEECRNFPEHNFYVVLGEMLSKLIEKDQFPDNFLFYSIGYRPATRVFSFKNRDQFFRELEEKLQPDVVFTTSGPSYWRPNAPHLSGYNLPHYIYRDSPYFRKIPFYKRLKWDLKGKLIKHFLLQDTDAYVVQTDDVNRRLKRWLNREAVYTVTNTCSAAYKNPQWVENKLPERTDSEFRFLTLSAWYPHKNMDIIPDVVQNLSESIRKNVKFVLTLPENDFREYFPEKLQRSIVNIGPVSPDEGPSVYRECDAIFLPTLLECFSANYAEAMAMGKPILTTDMGFARSICNKSASYFKPLDAKDAAGKIERLIQDEVFRSHLVEAGKSQLKTFDTPKERAEKYLSICEMLGSERNLKL